VLVDVLAGSAIRQPLVRDNPSTPVAPDAQNLRSRPHFPVGRVEQNIALKGPRSLLVKSSPAKPRSQLPCIINPEFDLSFDSHRKQRVYAGSGNRAKRRE
jgi:hypothetical protein